MGCHAGVRGDGRRSLSSSAGGCRMRYALELVEVDSDRLEEVLHRAESSLDEKDAALIRAVFESYAYVTELVEDKNTSIRRLRQLFFGTRTGRTTCFARTRGSLLSCGLKSEVLGCSDRQPGEDCEDGQGRCCNPDRV
jgi:hypothetical protein